MSKNTPLLPIFLCVIAAQFLFAYSREDAVPLPKIQDEMIDKLRRGEVLTDADKQACRRAYTQYRNAVSVANNNNVSNDMFVPRCLEADRMGCYIVIVKQAFILNNFTYPMTIFLREATYPNFKKQHLIDDDPFVALCCVLGALATPIRDFDYAVIAYKDLLEKDPFLAKTAYSWIETFPTVYGKHVGTDPELNKKFLDTVKQLPEREAKTRTPKGIENTP